MGKRYVSGVLMTAAVLLRSGMKRNFHVPFWRAVEKATSSLTLIIRDEALRLLALGRKATAHGGTVSQGSGRQKSTTEQVPTK